MTIDLTSILKPELIKVPLDGDTKRAVIDELCDLVCTSSSVTDSENFRKTVWERESQRSTGIGEGLAIPHGKCPGVREITMAIGIPPQPLEFDSIDGESVRLVVLLASPADRIADHIQALGRISKFMSDLMVRSRAYAADSSQDLYQLLAGLDAAARA